MENLLQLLQKKRYNIGIPQEMLHPLVCLGESADQQLSMLEYSSLIRWFLCRMVSLRPQCLLPRQQKWLRYSLPSNILDRYKTSLKKEKAPVESSSEAMGATTDEKTGAILDRLKSKLAWS